MYLAPIKEVCTEVGLNLYETKDAVLIIEFPKHNDGFTPLLVTLDGITWTPEASKDNSNSWSGKVCLRGKDLEKEILEMCHTLGILGASQIIETANKLQEKIEGIKVH